MQAVLNLVKVVVPKTLNFYYKASLFAQTMKNILEIGYAMYVIL